MCSPFQALEAQSLGFELPGSSKTESIPFEYVNGFIIIDVTFNQIFPLKFIFDTGANNTIITNKELVSLFNIPFGRTFTVYGADLSTPLYAHLAKSTHLSSGELLAPDQDILVLEKDYFKFEQITGMEVHGIIGSDMFRNYEVKINYRNRTIQLYKNNTHTKKTRGFKKMDMAVQKSKPYIVCRTILENGTELDLKLLIDTGASTAMLLDTKSDSSLTLPSQIIPGNLGFGMGGVMEGYVGRVPFLGIGDKQLQNVVCHFQEITPLSDSLSIIFRHGLIGNHILDRFDVIFDYPDQKFYLKPTRKWKRQFSFDKSGIRFISVGMEQKTLYVNSVIKGSPADLIGVKTGDVIVKINGKPRFLLTYDHITRIFRSKTGKKIKLKVMRGQELLKYEFQLKDLI